MIDYVDLIGIPFEYGGRGPSSYDCWGLLSEMFRRQGKIIPDYRSPTVIEEIALMMAADKYLWTEYAAKEGKEAIPYSDLIPGRALLLRVNGLACHVGFIHRPRHFLHTWEGTGGVTTETVDAWRQRILGVYGYE